MAVITVILQAFGKYRDGDFKYVFTATYLQWIHICNEWSLSKDINLRLLLSLLCNSLKSLSPPVWRVATCMWPSSITSPSVCRSTLSSSSTSPHVNCLSHTAPCSSSSWSSQSSFSPSGRVRELHSECVNTHTHTPQYPFILIFTVFCFEACRHVFMKNSGYILIVFPKEWWQMKMFQSCNAKYSSGRDQITECN